MTDPEWVRRLQRQMAPVLNTLAHTEELRQAAEQIERQRQFPALQEAIREIERRKLPMRQVQELVGRVQEQMGPLIPPETIQAMQRSIRPISPDLLRALEQQTKWQEQFSDIARRLEEINSMSEAAAEEEGVPEPPPPPEDEDDPAGWFARLPHQTLLALFLYVLATNNRVTTLIDAIQSEDVPAALLEVAELLAGLLYVISEAKSRKRGSQPRG